MMTFCYLPSLSYYTHLGNLLSSLSSNIHQVSSLSLSYLQASTDFCCCVSLFSLLSIGLVTLNNHPFWSRLPLKGQSSLQNCSHHILKGRLRH